MIKFTSAEIVFEEIPNEVCLALNISNCLNNCPGCHSSFLRKDIGEELTPELLGELISSKYGISCVCLMGEGNDPDRLKELGEYIKINYKDLWVGLYSGRAEVEPELYDIFDYVKVGPYIEARGPLNKPTTNQRLYFHGEDITYKFWQRIPGSVAKFEISDDKEQVERIREGLKRKKEKFGEAYCPCALPRDHGECTICPCEKYRTTGNCHCKLYKK